MQILSRRSFLRQSTVGACALPFLARPSLASANEAIRVAVVGFRGHGQTHIRNYLKIPGVRLVALCDADRAVLDREVARLDREGVKVEGFADVRRLLERKDIDAVSTATPNHWHALVTVWACQAGKHVCVEKPVSHNVWEGRKMVEAARKYDRLVQADLDLRSNPAHDEAAAYLRSGALGKVVVARGFVYKHRPSIGKTAGRGHIPESVDYDLWCGPAAKGPIDRKELHYDWHWVWNTGCGELGNNGPHQLDQIRWLLGEAGLPRRVMSVGGRFGYDDAGETPNTQLALYDYPSAPILFEVRGLPARPGSSEMDGYAATTVSGAKLVNRWSGKGPNTGVLIQCEGGYLDLDAQAAFDFQGREIRAFKREGQRDPQASFIAALRSGRRAELKTDIEEGHVSTCLCHLGNISYRVGQRTPPGVIREIMKGSPPALEAYGRFEEHLRVHQVDLAKTPGVLGPWLTLEPGRERFAGPLADTANPLLRRSYREPYVIPDTV